MLFAAAGSADERALRDTREAAALLDRECGRVLPPTYVTTARPSTFDLAAWPRGRRPFLAPYLLAPGLFHGWLGDLPAAGVAGPLGAHPRVVDLVVRRYRQARTPEGRRSPRFAGGGSAGAASGTLP